MAEATTNREGVELHRGSSEGAPSMQNSVDRIFAITGTTLSDIVDYMASKSVGVGIRIDRAESKSTCPDRFLRSCDSIGHSSPADLKNHGASGFCWVITGRPQFPRQAL